MRTARLSDSVLVVSGDFFDEHMTVLATGDGLVVIDTLATLRATRQAMEAVAAFSREPVRYLINTHFDVDHVAGNAVLAGAGAEIVGHANCARHLDERVFDDPASFEMIGGVVAGLEADPEPSHPADARRRRICLDSYRHLLDGFRESAFAMPAVFLRDDARIVVGGSTIELRHFAAGHTDADLAVVVPEARLVVAGDLVLGDGYSPVVHVIHGGSVVGLQRALEGIASVAGDDWCLVPGHGEIGGPSLIGSQRDYLGALFAGVNDARRRGLSLDEAKAALDIKPFRHHLLYDFVHVGHVEAAWRELGETGAGQP